MPKHSPLVVSQPSSRIAVVAKLFPTVSETFVMHHVTGLLDLGFEVDIYAFNKEQLDDYGHRDLDAFQLMHRLHYLPENLADSVELQQMASRGYDVVHCHFGEVAQYLTVLKGCLPETQFVVTFHGRDVRAATQVCGVTYADVFESFDHVVSICQYNRARLLEIGCPREKLRSLPNGVDTLLFSPSAVRSSPDGRLSIVSVARLHPDKNISFALRVMRRLVEKRLKFHYTVAGHGPLHDELEALISEYCLESHVTLLGQCSQERVIEILQESDVFFLPSRAEAAPVCVLEAQAMELPVVATRVGGMEELISHDSSGYLIECDDEVAATIALNKLYSSPTLRSQMGERGRRRMLEAYEYRALSRRYADLYSLSPPPRVSVVIPTHNRAHLIAKAIDSVLKQSFQQVELIIVDDGSTDDTRQKIEAWQSRFPNVIRYVYQRNKNAAAARNVGIELSRGEYVAFLDSDDYWHPEKLSRQVALLDANPAISMVHTDVEHVKLASYEPHTMLAMPQKLARSSAEMLLGKTIIYMSVVARRHILLELNGFDTNLTTTHDMELWLRIARVSELALIDKVLTYVRLHNEHLSTSKPERKLRDRLIVAKRAIDSSQDKESKKTWRRRLQTTNLELAQEYIKNGDAVEARRILLQVLRAHSWAGQSLFEVEDSLLSRLSKLLCPYKLLIYSLLRI